MLLEALRNEYRERRMARFSVWIAAYGVALWIVERTVGDVPGLLRQVFWIGALVAVFYYLGRLIGLTKAQMLWPVRRRLVVTYLFIAVVPILLIVILAGLGGYILNGQFAAFLVNQKIHDQLEELAQLNRVVAHDAYQSEDPSAEALINHIESLFVAQLGAHAEQYPSLEITVRVADRTRSFNLAGRPMAKPLTVPAWLDTDEFAGIVADENQIALRAVARGLTPVGQFHLILSQPFSPELLDRVGEGIGPIGVLPPPALRGGAPGPSGEGGLGFQNGERRTPPPGMIRSKSIQVPTQSNSLDVITVVGASTLTPTLWNGQEREVVTQPGFVFVTSRVMTLTRMLLATLGRFSRVYVILFVVVAVVFLLIELVALIIGVKLTRSITHTVDKIQVATQRVKAGDFSHRIDLPARDQLSALGEAFDSMTASVEGLLRESQEKLRLESELEIAREVQSQLFPQKVPAVAGLELYGVCKPARVVSGDYFDFLRLDENRLGLVLSDICGKGISAALLMASIQSALRAQLYNGRSGSKTASANAISPAEVAARLNLQLFENTPQERYATFFYAQYDAARRLLTYTNAGHLPPVLFRRGTIQRLTTGGGVVGLFWPMNYEQADVQLEPGDVLLAFTDGLTEPENIYGEEFGEERLLDVAQRALASPPQVLADEIYRSVSDWTGKPELYDDMTLVVAKVTAT